MMFKGIVGLFVTLTLAVAGGAVAADTTPMTPELAAKGETVRKRQEQRVTPQEKKSAAEALKAERLKVYQARQAVQQLNPANGSSNSEKPVH